MADLPPSDVKRWTIRRVDASGRGALTSTLFDALGWERPAETEVGVDLSYATVVVAMPPNAPSDWKLVLTQPDPPFLALHAVLVPIEGDRWIIAIADHHAVERPETWDAFLEASRSLIMPTVHKALRYAEPPNGIRHYRFPVSIWKRFELLPCLPRGVLPVADALCRFNPIHGQGMSSAGQTGSPAAGCVGPGSWGTGSDRGSADGIYARGRLGARDTLEHVH
jgi:hypothetical protein